MNDVTAVVFIENKAKKLPDQYIALSILNNKIRKQIP